MPKTSWYNNVRAVVDELGWDRIRRQVYRRANYRCEVCGGRGSEHPVECHEVWRYDDRTRVQALVRMIALCPSCHGVKHMGFAHLRGTSAQAREHLDRPVEAIGLSKIVSALVSLADKRTYTDDPVVMTVKALAHAGRLAGAPTEVTL